MHALLAVLLALAPAAETDTADDPAARAAELFSAGEFVEAAAAFEEAFAQTGDPALLFGRGQALRRAGNCQAAIDEFERFIALGPPPADVDEAKKVIASCERVLGMATAPAEPAPAEPTPAPTDPPPSPAPRPWHRDPAGGALLGSGLVLAAIGGGLLGGSFARARDRAGESESEWQTRSRGVRVMSTAGIVLLASGGVLAIASAVRWAIVARRDRSRSQTSRPSRAQRGGERGERSFVWHLLIWRF
jgi:hypothetical protein